MHHCDLLKLARSIINVLVKMKKVFCIIVALILIALYLYLFKAIINPRKKVKYSNNLNENVWKNVGKY